MDCKKTMPANFNFTDFTNYAQKAVDLLQAHGAEVVGLLKDGFTLFQALTNKDLTGVLLALNQANVDVTKVIAEIKLAFNLN